MDNEIDIEQFLDGKLYKGYNFFGCQFDPLKHCADFRVFAPHAKKVAVVGDFNKWKGETSVMKNNGGIWHVKICDVLENQGYKFEITTTDDRVLLKSDPFAFHSETRGSTASKIADLSKIRFNDDKYLASLDNHFSFGKPVNIYEAHLGSWRQYKDGNNFDYRKFADEMSDYLVEMGYTHIELMGIAEYPFDGSWGYQVTGYFAPTSRYGSPQDFAYLVDRFHSKNIGVIVDWVPGHFPKDANGLADFDGESLYEPTDPLRREHKEWGTHCFDYSSGAVKSFLISNARYWVDVFHVDGLRVDAVASMLYLDYARTEWRPNKYGKKENLEAIEFFKELNKAVLTDFPSTIMIAEESTAFPLVTKPPEVGGLGFSYKWNMGWMNDTLSYIKTDPLFRRGKHNNMTFSLTYAYSENYILPISHDEVVYGKCSLLNKMAGDTKDKFAGLRNYLMYMYAHPGKKLVFMGTEFGQSKEWNFKTELDWGELANDDNKKAVEFTKALNHIYLTKSQFFDLEADWLGFEWLVVDDCNQNVFVFERRNSNADKLIVVLNFSPCEYKKYRFGVDKGAYNTILTSDLDGFSVDKVRYTAEKIPSHKKEFSLSVDIKPFSGMYLEQKHVKETKTRLKKTTKKE